MGVTVGTPEDVPTSYIEGKRGGSMRFQATAFALLVSSTSAMAVQVFKCPDGAGKTVIQQTPCEGGTTMDVKPASGAAAPSTSWSGRAKLSKLQRDNEMAEAIRTGNPRVGMTSAQVRQAMGEPAQFASNNYGGGQKEQFVYHRPDATWYVQTVNGLVRSVKRAPPTPGGGAWTRGPGRGPTR